MAEKKNDRIFRALFFIALAIETPITVLLVCGVLTMALTRRGGDIMTLMAVMAIALGFTIIDIFHIRRKEPEKVLLLANAVILKLAAFCFGGIIFYLAPSVRVMKASVIFAVLFFICVLASAAIEADIRGRGGRVPAGTGIQVSPNMLTLYNARDHREKALSEYNAIYGKSEDGSSPEFEKEILGYASMPFIYLLMWLSERGYTRVRFEDGISPLETFGTSMDYSISRNDVSPEIIPFLDSYFKDFGFFSASDDYYLFDYYEAVRNPDKVYYCNEYSVSTYRKIRDRLDTRYDEFLKNRPVYYTGLSTYEDGKKRDFEIRTVGNVDSSYVSRCIETYETLSEMQTGRIERFIEYRYKTKVDVVHGLRKPVLTVSEQKQDRLQFTVTGEFTVKMPVVFSYFVRNGICFVPESDRDMGFINIDKAYEIACDDKDLYLIDSREKAEEAVSGGVLLLRNIQGQDLFLTPAASRIYDESMRRIDTLGALHKNVTYGVKPGFRDGCLVPLSLKIQASCGGRTVFSEDVDNIWY